MKKAIDCEDYIKVHPARQEEHTDWVVEYITHLDNVPICPSPYEDTLAYCVTRSKYDALFIADAMAKGGRINVDYIPLTIKQKELDNE